MSRRSLSFLGVSLGVHLSVGLALLFVQAPRAATPPKRSVTLRFSQPLPEASPATVGQEDSRGGPAPAADEERIASGPGRLSAPAPATFEAPAPAPAIRRQEGRLAGLPPAPAAPPPPPVPIPPVPVVSAPSPAEVLAQLPGGGAGAAGGGEARGFTGTPALEWGDRERRLLEAATLRFPDVLSEKGQEVDVEAELTVAASGVVSQVKITRSSGYIDVDRAVEQALRGYLFERSSSGEDRARIRFHFRLEHGE